MADERRKWIWKTPPWVPGHIETYLADPEAAHLWDASQAGGEGLLPSLLLTTTGRRSGEPRHSPLLYRKIGDDYVVIASKGGFPSHPAWYLNLVDQPAAEVRVGAQQLRVRARIAQGAERAALWRTMAEGYPPYDEYQARAKHREIPVVVLEPTI